MATRLFFGSLITGGAGKPQTFPTAGDKSTALPVGVDNGDGINQSQEMVLQNPTGANGATLVSTSAATTSQQSTMIARFSSSKLRAQTINANTWTIAFIGNESNAAANAFLAVSVYVYRPSTNAVVGFIRDSATTLGVEFANTLQTVTFAGSAVTCQAEDFLVLEAWNVATQGMATSYTVSFTTSVVSSPKYLETPQDLSFLDIEQGYIID